MTAPAPDVMLVQQFKDRTTPKSIFKRGRKHISIIDIALTDFHACQAPGPAKIRECRSVLEKCRSWITRGGDKKSTNFISRKAVVETLADQVFGRLQWEIFRLNKNASRIRIGRRRGNLSGRSLQGGYAHERSTYLNSGKQKAISGSSVSVLLEFAGAGQFGNERGQRFAKSFSNLTEQEYRDVMSELGEIMGFGVGIQEEVKFMPKTERINFMVVLEGGIGYLGFNRRFDTNGHDFPYVIDMYGSFYSTDHVKYEHNLDLNVRFNHSSFNAGKNVISAGIVQANNGRLTYIDNNSGHYKPTRQHLHDAISLLSLGGVDMHNVRVGMKEFNVQLNKLQFHFFYDGHRFLQNIQAIPDESHDAN